MRNAILLPVALLTLLPTASWADPCGMVPPIYTGPNSPITRVGAQKTYVFFKNDDDGRKDIAQLNEKHRETQIQMRSLQDEIQRMKQMVGFPDDAKLGDRDDPETDTMEFEYQKDMKDFGGGMDDFGGGMDDFDF